MAQNVVEVLERRLMHLTGTNVCDDVPAGNVVFGDSYSSAAGASRRSLRASSQFQRDVLYTARLEVFTGAFGLL